MKVVSVYLLLSIPSFCFAQFDSLGIKTQWGRGSITLVDGTILKGFIQNNEKFQQIRFKTELNYATERLVLESDIQVMEYLDPNVSSKRRFASINYKTPESKTEIDGVGFFEIIREFKQFAVLSQLSRVDAAIKTSSGQTYMNGRWVQTTPHSKKVGLEQYEKVYFFNEDGRLNLVLGLHYLERDKENFLVKNDKPIIDREVIEEQLAKSWDKIEQYIRENHLNLKGKSDLIRILDYYKELEVAGDN